MVILISYKTVTIIMMHKKIEQFLLDKKNIVRPKTLELYDLVLRSLNPYLKTNGIRKGDVKEYLNSSQFNTMKPISQNVFKTVIRMLLRSYKLEWDYVKNTRIHKKLMNPNTLPTKEEMEKAMKTIQHDNVVMTRCMLMIFWESGGRIDEIANVRLKDITIEQSSVDIYFNTSKTNERPVTLIYTRPFLIQWLNDHPDRKNPEAYLFSHWWRCELKKYSNQQLRNIVENAFLLIGKPIHPHLFRHAGATRDSKIMTPQEVCIKYGWSNTAILDRYSHMTSKNAKETYLQANGILPKAKETITTINNKECPNCKKLNAITNDYCFSCGSKLDIKQEKSNSDELLSVIQQLLSKGLKS